MPLSSSGSISFQQIQDEHGGSHPISIGEYYGKYKQNNSRIATSGKLTMNNLRGTGLPIHQSWGSYGSWGSCSASCGGGTQTQSRSCNGTAEYGGDSCSGSSINTQSCNTHSCVGLVEYWQGQGWPGHCGWSTTPTYCARAPVGPSWAWYNSCYQNTSSGHMLPNSYPTQMQSACPSS